jgi:hypothetical protein
MELDECTDGGSGGRRLAGVMSCKDFECDTIGGVCESSSTISCVYQLTL